MQLWKYLNLARFNSAVDQQPFKCQKVWIERKAEFLSDCQEEHTNRMSLESLDCSDGLDGDSECLAAATQEKHESLADFFCKKIVDEYSSATRSVLLSITEQHNLRSTI